MTSGYRKLTTVCLAAVLAFGLAACGGGGTTTAPPDPEPSPYEQAVAGIAAATTAAAAQAAYDAVKGDVTAAEGIRLQDAVNARIAALAMMDRAAAQKTALMTAAGNIDTSSLMSAADIAAANTAIAALKAALAAAADVSDADKAMYQEQVDAAETAVATAQSALDHEAQTAVLAGAVTALRAIDLFDLSTQEKVTAAEGAIAALRAALESATELSGAEKAVAMAELAAASRIVMVAQGRVDKASQMMALMDAVGALEALDLDNLMTQEQIAAVEDAITAVDLALAAATSLTDAEKLDATVDVTVAKRKVGVAKEALATNTEGQQQAITDAVAMLNEIDLDDLSDQAKVDAAQAAVNALKAALDGATHLSDADKAMYQPQLDAATTTVAMAQSALNHEAQTAALSEAVTALQAIDLSDLSTQAKVDAAEVAIEALQAALDGATELSAAEKSAAMTELAAASRIVMLAQGRVDKAGQLMALTEAHEALEAIDLDDLMTQEQIDAAEDAITAVRLALAAATDLTDTEKLNATVDMTVAERRVATAKEMLATNIEGQREAIMDAVAMLNDIDLEDLSDQAKIDAAQAAVDALEDALDGATHLSEADKAMYQEQLDTATETVRMAQTGMERSERMMAQRTAITDGVTMARTAVNGVNNESTDSEVSAADQAIADLEAAVAGAVDLPEGDSDVAMAQGTIVTLKTQLNTAKTARTAYLATKQTEEDKAMAKLGKDLHAALGPPGATITPANVFTNIATQSLSETTGLTVDANQGAGSLPDAATSVGDPPPVILKAGDSAGALGSWNGTHYAHTNTGTKVVNEAVVYTNKGPGKTVPFTDPSRGNTLATANAGAAPGYTSIKGYLDVATGGAVATGADFGKVMADAFTHSGTQNHALDIDTGIFTTRGTYDGAPGVYRCTGTCTSTNADGKGSPSGLGGVWHFKPDAGANAMVHDPDTTYLYFGWWLSKDKDGAPTAASAFTGVVGTALEGTSTTALATNPTTLGGSATYLGHAAGKVAMSNPLDGSGSGGHFTADATLTAKFGVITAPNNGGVSGTIENFMANGESKPWSVTLHLAPWGSDGAFATPAADVAATANVDESKGTTWSIDGNAAPRSGTWSGQMYDELPGLTTATPAGDGSDVPTSATGAFYSEFSAIGRMVGAFGAEKQ